MQGAEDIRGKTLRAFLTMYYTACIFEGFGEYT